MNIKWAKVQDDFYMKSGVWKCDESPTHAHHWFITGTTEECLHCHVSRNVLNKTDYQFYKDNKEKYANSNQKL